MTRKPLRVKSIAMEMFLGRVFGAFGVMAEKNLARLGDVMIDVQQWNRATPAHPKRYSA